MSGRTAVSYAGAPPMWCVVSAHPDRVTVSAHQTLRTGSFPGLQFPVAGVLADVGGFMRVLDLDRLPAVFSWPEAAARLGGVRMDPRLLRFGLRLRPYAARRGLAVRWGRAVQEAANA